MDISYIREIKHNYMIITADDISETYYESKMLEENSIEGLLKFHTKYINSIRYYCYDITSKQALSTIVQKCNLDCMQIKNIIIGIEKVLDKAEEYLLRESSLYIVPETIYIDADTYNVSLCFIPGEDNDISKSLRELMEYMLKYIDHNDTKAVVLAYNLYQKSQKDYYTIYDLVTVVMGSFEKENKTEDYPESNYSEDIKYNEYPENETFIIPDKRKNNSMKFILAYIASILTGYVILWLIKGKRGIFEYGIYLTLLYVLTAIIMLVVHILKQRKNTNEQKPQEKQTNNTEYYPYSMEREDTVYPICEETVVLDETVKKTLSESGKLISEDKDLENINIEYFPFMIGKSKSLSDYVIDRDTVSRLHMKIEKNNNVYIVTDLNSTNGTTVNGRKLNPQESVPIQGGDEIYIADCRYTFR